MAARCVAATLGRAILPGMTRWLALAALLIAVPPDIIHWGESAPGGQPTLFVYSGMETCFFPGDSGI